jgi:Uma2 family endonuclease
MLILGPFFALPISSGVSVGLPARWASGISLEMQVAPNIEFLQVADYLDGERSSELRHEYLGGMVYAMAGASDAHNTIAGNVFAELRTRLRGAGCRAFIGDMKAHIVIGGRDVFYYPDVMVTCDARDTKPYFKEFPKLIIEVLSETTESTDRREKFWNYTQIESLEEYILVAQDKREVTVFRRAKNWDAEILGAADQQLTISSLNLQLPLNAIYEGVAF